MSLCVFKDTFLLNGDRNEHRKTGTNTRTNALPHSFSVALLIVYGNGNGNGRNGNGDRGTGDAGRMQTGRRTYAGAQVLQENAKKSEEGRQKCTPPLEKQIGFGSRSARAAPYIAQTLRISDNFFLLSLYYG